LLIINSGLFARYFFVSRLISIIRFSTGVIGTGPVYLHLCIGRLKFTFMKTRSFTPVLLRWLLIACLLALFGSAFAQSGAIFTPGSLMNSTRIYPPMATLDDGKIIAFGGRAVGFIPSAYADIYDPLVNNFTGVPMNFPHDNTAVVKLFDGRYYIIGGATSGGVPAFSSCEIYDPATNTFTPAGAMAYARMWMAGAQLNNGNVLIVGAWYDNAAASIAECYDTAKHTYTTTNPVVTGRANPLLLPTDDGGAMLFGGWPSYGGGWVTSVEYYNPSDNAFHPVSSQLIPSDSGWLVCNWPYHNRPYSDYKMRDGRYMIFGSRNVTVPEYGLLAFDPASKTCSRINTITPVMDAFTNGGFYDLVLDKENNIAYLLGVDSGNKSLEISLTAVDLTSGIVYHPGSSFAMLAGEYLYPQIAFTPVGHKILLEGISSTGGDYFHATDKSYVITPQSRLGVNDLSPETTSQMFIYPNPSTMQVNVKFENLSQQQVGIRVTDLTGRALIRGEYKAINGTVRINIAELSAGVYIIEARTGEVLRAEFIKQ
jgi:hypothetical protein